MIAGAGLRASALVLVLAIGAVSCAGDDGTTAAERGATSTSTDSGRDAGASPRATEASTVAAGRLTVCSDIPYPPFSFEREGQVTGIDADIMRAIAESLELEVVFKDTDFDGVFVALAGNACDVIASAVPASDERAANHGVTRPYFEVRQSLLVRKGDEARFADLEALKGRKVGVRFKSPGSTYVREHERATGVKVRDYPALEEMFVALEARQVDAVIDDLPLTVHRAGTTETAVTSVFDDDGGDRYVLVVAEDDGALLDAINGALDELVGSGRYAEILETHLGELASRAAVRGPSSPTTTER